MAQLELDGLGAFNLLLGANDVGKTSVLEAVFLLAGFANLQALLTLVREQRVQVFATTHSLGPLESLRQALNDERFPAFRHTTNCYTLQQDQDGLVRPYRYDYAQFEHCIAHGIEIQ